MTPDSFSDGGSFSRPEKAIAHAMQLEAEGADIIDIGGESTRPGAMPVSLEEEARRVLSIIEQLSKKTALPISIDTKKAEIAQKAIEAGATIINDVGGINGDSNMIAVAARNKKTGIIFMHAKGTPQNMQQNPHYKNLLKEIRLFFIDKIALAHEHKISNNRIALDPGIGFGKTVQHNLRILHRVHYFQDLGLPIMLGPSRKSFIGHILGLPASDRIEGTAAAIAISVLQGAKILRVHDVKEMKRVVTIAEAIRKEAVFQL